MSSAATRKMPRPLGRTFLTAMTLALLFACQSFTTGCARVRTVVLPGDRLIETIPSGHCLDCHGDYYDGRAVADKGYLLDMFKLLEDK